MHASTLHHCLAVASAVVLMANSIASSAQHAQPVLIPLPSELSVSDGEFILGPSTTIHVGKSETDSAQILAQAVERSTGLKLNVMADVGPKLHDNTISLRLDTKLTEFGDEGYTLEITPKGALIKAAKSAGLFYGVQTFSQLLPIKPDHNKVEYPLTCVTIKDVPRFGWRGYMLDSSRHFVTKKTILDLLDALAMVKINVFHWHIVDDQAWRLDIAKYPKLVKPVAGSWNAERQKDGYYSADDVREIVNRAQRLHIMIVPEIEMPSHATQVATVIPEGCCLGTDGKPLPPGAAREICLGSDKAIAELKDILVETMAMFPNSPIIHLGGDEAHPKRWRVCSRCKKRMAQLGVTDPRLMQKWFMNKMSQFVHEHGRTSMAWADRLSLGIPEGQIVHGWHVGELEEAVAKGFRAVYSRHEFTYFDYGQGPGDTAFGGASLPIDKVYSFDPVQGLTPEQAKLVLGAQAQLWSELIWDDDVFEKTFPRILALAEVTWTPQEKRDSTAFSKRLKAFLPRLDAMGIAYFKPAKRIDSWTPEMMSLTWKDLEWDITGKIDKPGSFHVEFFGKPGTHKVDIRSATLLEDGKEISKDEHEGVTAAGNRYNVYRLQVDPIKPGATYTLRASMQCSGGTDSQGDVLLR